MLYQAELYTLNIKFNDIDKSAGSAQKSTAPYVNLPFFLRRLQLLKVLQLFKGLFKIKGRLT